MVYRCRLGMIKSKIQEFEMNTTNHRLWTTEELKGMAARASAEAIARLKAKGIPIIRGKNGQIEREYADGRIEILEPLPELPPENKLSEVI